MEQLERFLKWLERHGVNTRRWQWKLYRFEQKRQAGNLVQLPARLHWLKYEHKFCLKCGAVADREGKTCGSCGGRLPSMWRYRVFRILGLMGPQSTPATIMAFLSVIIGLFVLAIGVEGLGGLSSFSAGTLLRFGAWGEMLVGAPSEYWRMLAFGLMHGGVIHVGFNCLALSQIGPVVEGQIGREKMLVVITVTQLASAIASVMMHVPLTIGASGWLFGLIGFGIAYFHTSGGAGRMYRDVLLKWAVYALLFGFMVGANNAAHVGGLLGGIVMGFVPQDHPMRTSVWSVVWRGGFWVSAVLWLTTLAFLGHSIVTWG